MPEEDVQQLAEVIAAANAYQAYPWNGFVRLPEVHQLRYLDIARAVLRSGLIVPTSEHQQLSQAATDWRARHDHLLVGVLHVAEQLERDSNGQAYFLAIANWLRALTQQEPR